MNVPGNRQQLSFLLLPLPHGTATPRARVLHMIPDVQTTGWFVEMGAPGRIGGVITNHHSIPFGRARELTSWPSPLKKHIGVLSICVHMEQGPPVL
jgi:hypothetical protein